ncbi:GNAT family N-acetyltransferase [Bacillus sp. UNC437CL72CviS29]|uniref:GNAT family N-acetyltransferase n=1 Tax=Bacillus sp. UNC437CL72CviS29 TaxID=1340430 RepID=UPI0004792284|nr:GNAT family N-acetyltransferase [Bacillus sp. UNC437CL72CviS29]
MLFQKGDVSIRYVIEEDVNTISKWLTNPEVLQYYEGRDNPQSPEKVRMHFIQNPKSDEKRCLVEYAGEQIGYVQMYPIESEWNKLYGYRENQDIWGMDQFIGEPIYWNRGIGTELVQATITYIINELGAEAIAMDPRVSNERAIRCYEKCGFQKVKRLKAHELHEGKLEDCWMMEYRKKGSDV